MSVCDRRRQIFLLCMSSHLVYSEQAIVFMLMVTANDEAKNVHVPCVWEHCDCDAPSVREDNGTAAEHCIYEAGWLV